MGIAELAERAKARADQRLAYAGDVTRKKRGTH